eukprot:Skav205014  [mRNA]  locus=scaffold2134:163117:166196:+ [translate_table: standard]
MASLHAPVLRLGAAFLVCATTATAHPVHHARSAMTVDAEGDVSTDKMKQLSLGNCEMRSHPESLEESQEQILPSANDLAYKAAMDLGFGTTGMALDDYPFACICNVEGLCEADPAETTCKLRAGQNSAVPTALHRLVMLSCLLFAAAH